TVQGSLPDKRDKQRKECQRGGCDLLRYQQPRTSYRGKGRGQPRGHRYCRWSLIACNRKRGRQAAQVQALERPGIQKMTRRCRFPLASLCPSDRVSSAHLSSDNLSSVQPELTWKFLCSQARSPASPLRREKDRISSSNTRGNSWLACTRYGDLGASKRSRLKAANAATIS